MNSYNHAVPVSHSDVNERALFIQKTYMNLAGAILAFIAVEAILLKMPFAQSMAQRMMESWLLVLIGFMAVSWIAESWALKGGASLQKQYIGLGIYIVAQAIIFMPILYIAAHYSAPDVIPAAAITTFALFGGLTFVALTSKRDFSFLGGILKIASLVAMCMIFAHLLFGISLGGTIFAGAMVIFCAGCILYDTSRIMHHYRTDQYVSAALSLFASVALMFWYILQLFMSSSD